MGKLTIRSNIALNATPPNGDGDAVLGRDASSGDIGLNTTALSTTLLSGQIILGNASNQAVAVTPTGDVTISDTGVTAITAGVIVNADVSGSAAIAVSKLAALTASRALATDGSGIISASSVTSTELGFLSGVSSAIQTQLNAKQATITGAATTIVSLNLTSNRAVISNGSGKIEASAVTSTELGYLSGVTSAVQTQLNSRLTVNLTSPANGDIIYHNGVEWVNLPRGTNGQTLQSTSTTIQWAAATANGLPTGGTAGQYLRKSSGTDFDAAWDTFTVSDVTDLTASAAELNILDGATLTVTELNYVDGVTSAIQTQLDSKLGNSLSYNAIFVGSASNLATQLAAGTNGQHLTIVGGSPQWTTPAAAGDVTGPGSSTDNAVVRFNGTLGDSIQNSGVIIDDSNNISGAASITVNTTGALRTSTSDTNTLLLQAYDVDGTAYTTFATLTAGNTPTMDLSTAVTQGGAVIYRVGGTDVALADGGTGASLADPGADRVLFWDDSAGQVTWLTMGTNLTITGTTLDAAGGGGGVSGPGSSTDNAVVRWDGAAGNQVQNSGVIVDDSDNISGVANLTIATGGAVRTATSDTNTLLLQAYDVDGTAYTTFATLTAGNTPTFDLSDSTTKSGQYIYRAAGTDVALADGGTGASLTDPGADRIMFWDDSAGQVTWLATGTNLTITGTTIDATFDDEEAQDAVGTILLDTATIDFTYDDATPSISAAIVTNSVSDSLIRQSAGLSVIGRSTNSTGNVADITASSDNQILRRSGTSIGFGSIDLSQSNAVGSSILAIANGGTGASSFPGWLLASGGTLTGANTITGTTSNTIKLLFDSLGTTQTNGAGVWLQNSTAAAAGAQQRSPSVVWEGQGWKTDATAASQSVRFSMDLLPVQGTAAPTGTLLLRQSINAAAYSTILSISTTGDTILTTTTSGTAFTCKTVTNNYFRANESGSVFLGSTSSVRIGSATNHTTTFSISGGSVVYQTDSSHYFTATSASTISTGNAIKNQWTGTIDASTGSNTGTFLKLVPTYNISASTAAKVYDFLIEPVETALANTTHYGIVDSSTTALSGVGTGTPTAKWHIGAGTTTMAPLKLTSGTNLTTPEAGAVEFDGTNYFATSSTTRYTLAKTLTATASLNFGSTTAGTNSDLTITVTGAADGDAVVLGVPNAAIVANSCYTAWVSAADTVTVRFNNYDTLSAADPASATFRVSVIKY